MKKKISVIGLGKLGLPIVACFALKGFDVIGVDIDINKINALKKRQAPLCEPRLQDLLNTFGEHITVTQDTVFAVLNSDITFVIVPTPSKSDGSFSLDFVLGSCKEIGKALKEKSSYHLVGITSTIMPGDMDNLIHPCLEHASGKHVGLDFGLCYSPEFIAIGSVVHDFLNPDLLLIGQSDPNAGEILATAYRLVCDVDAPVVRMNFINAELVKLAVNTYVTTKISFANMLGRICEKLPGADIDVVTRALGFDSRIGIKYLKGAVSYGGPCFPRDNVALCSLAHKIGAKADIANVTDKFNRSQIKWLSDLIEKHLEAKGTVGILGLTYKPNTDVIEEAVGFLLAQELISRNIPLVVYDPVGMENSKNVLGELSKKVNFATTAEKCIESSNVIVLTTPWREFNEIPLSKWKNSKQATYTVIDCWRVLKHLASIAGINYVPLGIGELK